MDSDILHDGQEHSPTWLDLYDWRRRVASMYHERELALRAGEDEQAVLRRFRAAKDALFTRHPQSPLSVAQRPSFTGLSYFPYNPRLRLEALMEPEGADEEVAVVTSSPEAMPMRRAARLSFAVDGTPVALVVYWIDVYGGGLFLP